MTDINKLEKMLNQNEKIRAIECNSGLAALVIERTKVIKKGKLKQFNALWISSLCDSILRGKPDIEVVELKDRLNSIEWIMETSEKPIIVDLDSGGKVEHFLYSLNTLAKFGVSAVVIEDKIGSKKNSLFIENNNQNQDTIQSFSNKIIAGKRVVKNNMWIIARIESLNLGKGWEDAFERAKCYISSGADAILIHHNKPDILELKTFCMHYKNYVNKVPLALIPTAYSYVYEEELFDLGADIIIYANQLTRGSIAIMEETAKGILENERALEVSEKGVSVKKIITYVEEIG